MTQFAKEKDLNELSFLHTLPVLDEEPEDLQPTYHTKTNPFGRKNTSFLNIPFKGKFAKNLIAEVEKAFPTTRNKYTNKQNKNIILDVEKETKLSTYPTVLKATDEDIPSFKTGQLSLSNDKKSWPFSLTFLRKRKPVEIQYKTGEHATIPVIKKEILSAHQIVDSKSLVIYSSTWVKTIFEDKILFRAIPATGTNLLILPKGRFYFVQFAYQKTPIHPTQLMIQQKLTPQKVEVFHDFLSFRDWIYTKMRDIQA